MPRALCSIFTGRYFSGETPPCCGNLPRPDLCAPATEPTGRQTAWSLDRVLGTVLGVSLLAACGGADAARADGSASLEAVLSIERLEDAGHSDMPSASAMAQFVILPTDADVHDTLGAAGLRAQLPERTGCKDLNAAVSPRRGQNGLRNSWIEPLELLEAGEVSIRAGDRTTRLALNSFPPSGSASGVIYTTPDLSAEPLPPDENYTIRATGSSTIPPLSIKGRAPLALSDITIGGQPLERSESAALDTDSASLDSASLDATSLDGSAGSEEAVDSTPLQPLMISAGQPLDITWAVGVPGDRVYVELDDGEHGLACAFPDEDGSGTVPGSLTAQLRSDAGSSARLSVHRIREAVQPGLGLAGGLTENGPADTGLDEMHPETAAYGSSLETTVRFDFETTAVVRVQ